MSRPITPGDAMWDEGDAQAIIASLRGREGAMLPILHALQERFGFVPPQATDLIADTLNLSRAEVHGTISFYHDFRTAPPPRRVVKLCRAEACQAVGCEDLVSSLARDHGVSPDCPTEDLAVETVYCLGNCALGPAALVGENLYGRLDAACLADLCGLSAVPA